MYVITIIIINDHILYHILPIDLHERRIYYSIFTRKYNCVVLYTDHIHLTRVPKQQVPIMYIIIYNIFLCSFHAKMSRVVSAYGRDKVPLSIVYLFCRPSIITTALFSCSSECHEDNNTSKWQQSTIEIEYFVTRLNVPI